MLKLINNGCFPSDFISVTNYINLEGLHNLNRWLEMIGFRNLRLTFRCLYLRKFEYLPPKTTLAQRITHLYEQGVVLI